jgi:hypothetical protein
MTEKKLKLFNKLFNELWKYFKEHSDPDDSDEFWASLRNEGAALNDSFRELDDPDLKDVAEQLIVTTIHCIQNIYRRKEGRL